MADMSDNLNNSNAGGKFSDTNLIVNYLPPTLNDAEFKSLFESIGPVSACRIIRDRTTGLSYGYGFIDFVNPDHAKLAIDALDGMQLQNKKLKVSLSRQGDDVRASNLYLSNLPKFLAESDLVNMFSKYGSVIQTKILTDPATNASRGVGFVRFSTREEAQHAMDSTNGTKPIGFTTPIAVKFAEDNREKAKKIQQAILSGTLPSPGGVYPPSGPAAAAAAALGLRLPMANNPMGGGMMSPPANQFGMGYQGDLGGGPMRGGQPRQRFDPMAFGGSPMGGPAMMGAGVNGFGGAAATMESPTGYPLFVYNIGTDTDERALFQLFYLFGALQKVTVVRDADSKQSKGYGFVTMVHMHEAQNAIKNLNGMVYKDKRLQVSLKQPKSTQALQQFPTGPAAPSPGLNMTPQSPMMVGGMGGPVSPGPSAPGAVKNGAMVADSGEGYVLFVYNIGLDADERQLWQLFQPFGAILKVHVSRAPDTRKCKGFGFVTMAKYQEAQSAIQSLHGFPYCGRNLQVSFKQAGVGKGAANASSAGSTISDFTAGNMNSSFTGGMGNPGMGNHVMGNSGIGNPGMMNHGTGNGNSMGNGMGNMVSGMGNMSMGNFGNGVGRMGGPGQFNNFFTGM